MSQKRVIIESVSPSVDHGRYPAKRVIGDTVTVTAVIYADGHDLIRAVINYRDGEEAPFTRTEMSLTGNDQWTGSFPVERIGAYEFHIEAWVDHFETWLDGLQKKVEVNSADRMDLAIGAQLLSAASERVAAVDSGSRDAKRIRNVADRLRDQRVKLRESIGEILQAEIAEIVGGVPDTTHATRSDQSYTITVDPLHAQFSTWYEMFPRSLYGRSEGHGTFREVKKRLSYIAGMGFDVLYFPPIHPIGQAFRKGRNNALVATERDPGSPWAIGAEEGGHKDIHPELGTLDDFRDLIRAAEKQGIRMALDIAFQCSPDHPWVTGHPGWFVQRPDKSIQYAENPPKKYQDIYPINFESEDWQALWQELLSVFEHWIDAGVTIFRVDNPHTKSFPFWEWCIAEIKSRHSEVIFLAEAFTRPHRMYGLAKIGFSQSYTYFTWRTGKDDLQTYFTELAEPPIAEFFRPNLWPNTPDILHEYLQEGGRAGFMVRLVLAATLSSSYGIYGPPFELQEAIPREPGSEEYLDSEKYEIRNWKTDDPRSLKPYITAINTIRREHPALQRMKGRRFHATDNEQVIAYSRSSEDGTDLLLVVVNLSCEHTHSAWVEFSPAATGLEDSRPFRVRELLSGETFTWEGYWNFIKLDPFHNPAQIFALQTV